MVRPIQFAANSNARPVFLPTSLGPEASAEFANRLTGIISSLPGTVTPISFVGGGGDNSSGINLMNTNSFVGDIGLLGGTLGINFDASLGNPANTLFLDVASLTAGGLQFLNGGITVARPVVLQSPTRIVSDGGDVNTISGPVSGGPVVLLFKDGTGTLVLSGVNTQSGLRINDGTVRVAAEANLGNVNFGLDINSGATLAVTGTFVDSRLIFVGPFSGTLPGTSTIDVAAGQTLTLNGLVAGTAGALLKTGTGTLVLGSTDNRYGGTTVQQGGLQVAADGSLGPPACRSPSAGPVL